MFWHNLLLMGFFGFWGGGRGEEGVFCFSKCYTWFLHKNPKSISAGCYLLCYIFFDRIKVNREYLTFISQIQNLIWLFPNKSLVWLYGKQLQLLCKTHIQIVFKIVLKQCPRQSHNAKTTYCPSKTKILVNYFYVYIHTYISPKDWVRFFTQEHILSTA